MHSPLTSSDDRRVRLGDAAEQSTRRWLERWVEREGREIQVWPADEMFQVCVDRRRDWRFQPGPEPARRRCDSCEPVRRSSQLRLVVPRDCATSISSKRPWATDTGARTRGFEDASYPARRSWFGDGNAFVWRGSIVSAASAQLGQSDTKVRGDGVAYTPTSPFRASLEPVAMHPTIKRQGPTIDRLMAVFRQFAGARACSQESSASQRRNASGGQSQP